MKDTNLKYLFIDRIIHFAHLVTPEKKSKEEFLNLIKENYSLDNPATKLFFLACERSTFETIRLNDNQDAIIFNQ